MINKLISKYKIVTILFLLCLFFSCKDNSNKSNVYNNNQTTQSVQKNSSDLVKEEIFKTITYILDIYPDEVDEKKRAEERKMGYQVHVTTPRWMVIKGKLNKEGFRKVNISNFSFSSYNGLFDRFKARLEDTETVFFQSDSYQGHKVVIAIAVNNSGVKDREIKID